MTVVVVETIYALPSAMDSRQRKRDLTQPKSMRRMAYVMPYPTTAYTFFKCTWNILRIDHMLDTVLHMC